MIHLLAIYAIYMYSDFKGDNWQLKHTAECATYSGDTLSKTWYLTEVVLKVNTQSAQSKRRPFDSSGGLIILYLLSPYSTLVWSEPYIFK